MNATTSVPRRRLELVLAKPALGWFPKPTVVVNGRGQPVQWGRGSWHVDAAESATIRVFLFNRLWKYGAAEFQIGPELPSVLVYSAPWLPFRRGRLRAATQG